MIRCILTIASDIVTQIGYDLHNFVVKRMDGRDYHSLIRHWRGDIYSNY